MRADGKTWHKDHLRCIDCDTLLLGQGFSHTSKGHLACLSERAWRGEPLNDVRTSSGRRWPLWRNWECEDWRKALLPGDRVAFEEARLVRARELVHAAPSLCAKLPGDLLEAVAQALRAGLQWPAVPSLRAAAHLPPQERVGEAAIAERRRVVAALRAVESAAATEGDSTAGEAAEDMAAWGGAPEDEAAAAGQAWRACVDEFKSRLECGDQRLFEMLPSHVPHPMALLERKE